MLLKCHIGFRGETHSSCCRQAEGQEGPCCRKRDDDVDLRRLRQTMRLAHWSVCPFVCCLQVAPMTWGSVDLDDSVHRVCVCVCFVPGCQQVTLPPRLPAVAGPPLRVAFSTGRRRHPTRQCTIGLTLIISGWIIRAGGISRPGR